MVDNGKSSESQAEMAMDPKRQAAMKLISTQIAALIQDLKDKHDTLVGFLLAGIGVVNSDDPTQIELRLVDVGVSTPQDRIGKHVLVFQGVLAGMLKAIPETADRNAARILVIKTLLPLLQEEKTVWTPGSGPPPPMQFPGGGKLGPPM